MPVYRPMKTVVASEVEVLADCFEAWNTRADVAVDDRPGIRRMNRVMKYLETLAWAHIPFANRLITSYRSTSHDPFAFEVSEWDVPVWYAIQDNKVVWIGLMPYWSDDFFPEVWSTTGRDPFVATSLDEVQAQAETDVAPGKLELLDALSLMYRGRYGDAVRSVITAIEVALEFQIRNVLAQKGHTDEQIEQETEKTRDSFFDRLQRYEHLSQRRVPGPILHCVPYINGIRLRSELDQTRRLRHKIVHEGNRVDLFERGPILRAFETMSWLFEWLTGEDEHGPEGDRNYTFFSTLRGQPRLPFEYVETGVRVHPELIPKADESIVTADELIHRQYLRTTECESSDLDLCVRMSFEFIGIDCEEGPPEPLDRSELAERYVIRYSNRTAIVFCLEADGLIDVATTEAVVARVADQRQVSDSPVHALVIVHHQRQSSKKSRLIEDAIPDNVQRVFEREQLTTMTALDLQLLARAVDEKKCQAELARDMLFLPGRQGIAPPGFECAGIVRKYYPAHSAASIELSADKVIRRGDTIIYRLTDVFFDETITSIEIDGEKVEEACGPCRAGVKTALTKDYLWRGQRVYIRT